jgi:hypothetical protein
MLAFLYVVVFLFLAACATPSDPMAASEVDTLQRQILRQFLSCWTPPAGIKGTDAMVAQVRVLMRPDRTVDAITTENQARYNQDPVFRAVAESVRQAIEKCSPLNLPPDKYEQWRDFRITFYPPRLWLARGASRSVTSDLPKAAAAARARPRTRPCCARCRPSAQASAAPKPRSAPGPRHCRRGPPCAEGRPGVGTSRRRTSAPSRPSG